MPKDPGTSTITRTPSSTLTKAAKYLRHDDQRTPHFPRVRRVERGAGPMRQRRPSDQLRKKPKPDGGNVSCHLDVVTRGAHTSTRPSTAPRDAGLRSASTPDAPRPSRPPASRPRRAAKPRWPPLPAYSPPCHPRPRHPPQRVPCGLPMVRAHGSPRPRFAPY